MTTISPHQLRLSYATKCVGNFTKPVSTNCNPSYDCSYYKQLTMPSKPCVYVPVTCDLPPVIEHSSIVTKTKQTYKAGDAVRYECDEGYAMIGNDTSECVTLAIMVLSFLPLSIKYRKRLFKNELNLKRNREFDAFVSYTYDASNDFAKGFLHRELEVEATPPFRLLFHTRDFHAATLILVNIIEAVRKSNCAIILMCQEYIDSGWCREEFQVTNI